MTELKAGVIGAGVFGRHHAKKYIADARTQLIGLYDPVAENAEASAAEHGAKAFNHLGELIDAVDVMTVASPAVTHYAVARAALDAGVHVLTEKPLAVRAADGADLVELAKTNNLVLACGHQERLVFNAMGLFAAGERPLSIESVREGTWSGRGTDVSATLDLMTHDLDLALTLLGTELETVEASGETPYGPTPDLINARLVFVSGAEATFRANRAAPERKRTMRIVYPSGEVRIDFLERTFENTTALSLNPNFTETPDGKDPLGANVSRFISAVTGEAPRPAVTGEEALKALELALRIDAAAAGLPSIK